MTKDNQINTKFTMSTTHAPDLTTIRNNPTIPALTIPQSTEIPRKPIYQDTPPKHTGPGQREFLDYIETAGAPDFYALLTSQATSNNPSTNSTQRHSQVEEKEKEDEDDDEVFSFRDGRALTRSPPHLPPLEKYKHPEAVSPSGIAAAWLESSTATVTATDTAAADEAVATKSKGARRPRTRGSKRRRRAARY